MYLCKLFEWLCVCFYSISTAVTVTQQMETDWVAIGWHLLLFHLPVLSAGISAPYPSPIIMSAPPSLHNDLHLSFGQHPACPKGADPGGAPSLPGSPEQQGTRRKCHSVDGVLHIWWCPCSSSWGRDISVCVVWAGGGCEMSFFAYAHRKVCVGLCDCAKCAHLLM